MFLSFLKEHIRSNLFLPSFQNLTEAAHDFVIKGIHSSAGCGFIRVIEFYKAMKFNPFGTHFFDKQRWGVLPSLLLLLIRLFLLCLKVEKFFCGKLDMMLLQ